LVASRVGRATQGALPKVCEAQPTASVTIAQKRWVSLRSIHPTVMPVQYTWPPAPAPRPRPPAPGPRIQRSDVRGQRSEVRSQKQPGAMASDRLPGEGVGHAGWMNIVELKRTSIARQHCRFASLTGSGTRSRHGPPASSSVAKAALSARAAAGRSRPCAESKLME
jgi:hypothetical protein